jgi:hypothetical protein
MRKWKKFILCMMMTGVLFSFAACSSGMDTDGTDTNGSGADSDYNENVNSVTDGRDDDDSLGDDLENAGDDIMDGVDDVGDGIADGVEDLGDDIEDGVDNMDDNNR